MPLWDNILKAKQEANEYVTDHLLLMLDEAVLNDIESRAASDGYLSKIATEMNKISQGVKIDDIEGKKSLFQLYSEAKFYLQLRRILSIEAIDRQERKSPDFRLISLGEEYYAEAKAFCVVGDKGKYKEIMNEGTESRIRVEDQLSEGRSVGVSEEVIQPYQKRSEPYNPRSFRMVIETLIDKMNPGFRFEAGR